MTTLLCFKQQRYKNHYNKYHFIRIYFIHLQSRSMAIESALGDIDAYQEF